MMGILSGLASFIGGKAFDKVVDTATKYLPPEMSEVDRLNFEREVRREANEQQRLADKALADASNQLDKRIAEQEGTARDLLQMPILGRIIVFLRGMQRPVWGFATLYFDYKWFTAAEAYSDQQGTALIVINLLVLGFLFGERAIKNLEPLIIKVFTKEGK